MRARRALVLKSRSAWLLAPVAALALLLVQCSSESGADDGDGDVPLPTRDASARPIDAPTGPGDDGGADAPGPAPVTCDGTKPFGTPVRVADFDALAARASPHLSADELRIYFTTESATDSSNLSMATRASITAPFENEQVLSQSTSNSENAPTVGADDLTLWFYSLRNGSADIFLATRTSPKAAFGAATSIPVVNGSMTIEASPYFRSAASELWFVSERTGSALLDVYVSKRTDGAFATPFRVPEISSAGDEFSPQPSEDGRTIIVGTDRDGGLGKEDIWIARRASDKVAYGAPAAVVEINSAYDDQPGWLSADGCRIWFSSGRETDDDHQQIFFAERPPL